MTHPDWQTTHHGRSTRQDFIGEGDPIVPEKCKQPRLNDVKDRCSGSLTGSVDAVATNAAPQEAEPVAKPTGNFISGFRCPHHPATRLRQYNVGNAELEYWSCEGCHSDDFHRRNKPAPAPAVPVEGDLREAIAKLIYERGMLFMHTGKPAWVERGNSIAQTEARRIAAEIIAALRAQPAPQVNGLKRCATEGCGNEAVINFIRGNVGSHYCGACYHKIHALEQDRLSALSGEAQR